MDYENDKLRDEDFVSPSSQQPPPPMFLSQTKYTTMNDEFPYDPPPILLQPPPPPPPNGFLQEFHNLDEEDQDQDPHHNHHHQVFGVHSTSTGCNFDSSSSFDAFPYGSSSSNMDFYEYECKPFADHHHHINGDTTTNFHNPAGYLMSTIHHRNNYNDHHFDIIGSNGTNDNTNNNNQLVGMAGLQEMKPYFVAPDEISSCIDPSSGGSYHPHNNNPLAAEYCYKNRMMSSGSNTTAATTATTTITHLINRGANRASGLPLGTKKAWKGRKKNNVVKGQWTVDEDRLLVQLVEQYGIRKWSHIAQMLPGRIGKQCRERWHNHLRPDIKKDTWTEEEDKVLIQSHAEIGNKWAEIAKRLPGRTENSIKNHWNATKRRQYSKRKCRSKYPRGSILQDYIKSLNLDNSGSNLHGRRSSSAAASSKNNISSAGKAPLAVLSGGHHQENNNSPNNQLQENSSLDDFCENDRLVPNFDFSNEEVPDFGFEDKMFQDGCNIDSLLDGLPSCAPLLVDGKSFDEPEVPTEEDDATTLTAAGLDFEVKKELDLVEMMIVSSQKKGF